jgi:hypothetical protein
MLATGLKWYRAHGLPESISRRTLIRGFGGAEAEYAGPSQPRPTLDGRRPTARDRGAQRQLEIGVAHCRPEQKYKISSRLWVACEG